MGLEGVEYSERMESFNQLGPMLSEGGASSSLALDKGPISTTSALHEMDMDCSAGSQLQVLLQAQALLRKSELYQKIDEALRWVSINRPNIHTLPQTSVDDEDRVTSWHRDAAISNLRFLNLFYGYRPWSFALSVNLLDRLLGKVRAHPKYLSCIAVACFYIAIKTQEEGVFIPSASELVKLSQCGGTAADLLRMERLVLEKLQYDVPASVTPLTFLRYFCEVLASKVPKFEDPGVLNAMIAKLEVLVCQFDFAKYRAETLALSLLSCILQDMDLLGDNDLVTTLVELQDFCQISDYEFLQSRGLVTEYLAVYCSQRSKVPRLQLVWTVSRRTLNKMKPSTRILLDLEPIMEDEADENETDDSDDTGPFDSENE
jgi:hypothetical protein